MAQAKKEKAAGNSAETSSRQLSSGTETPKSLKPEPKIAKNSSNQNIANIKQGQGNSQSSEKPLSKKKSIQVGNKGTNTNQRKDGGNLKSRDGNKEKNDTNDKYKEKNQTYQKDKDKLGGLIFICNAKTKPDCFRYHVMGVPLNKKDIVMGIKPGLKLFLYDFDLKLMYGIYKASSAGGMKLEPAAFGGAFPAQVRFKVDKDCYPLPDTVFKMAIKGNYDEKTHKFKMELTVQQVEKLTQLFRPASDAHANVHSFVQEPQLGPFAHAPSVTSIPADEILVNAKEAQPRACIEPLPRGTYSYGEARRFLVPYDYEREQPSRFPNMASIKKEIVPRDPLFLSEKDYRTYGLCRERFISTPSVTVPTATSDQYTKDHERIPAPTDRDMATRQNAAVRPDPLFLTEKEYRAYGLRVGQELPSSNPPASATSASNLDPSVKDPRYLYQYGNTSSDSYSWLPRREGASSKPYPPGSGETYLPYSSYTGGGTTNPSQWIEAAEPERLYPTYPSTAISVHNLTHHHSSRSDLAATPVSSWYSFSGPSSSYY